MSTEFKELVAKALSKSSLMSTRELKQVHDLQSCIDVPYFRATKGQCAFLEDMASKGKVEIHDESSEFTEEQAEFLEEKVAEEKGREPEESEIKPQKKNRKPFFKKES